MMTLFCILMVILSPLAYTAGVMAGGLVALPLSWMPDRLRAYIVGPVAGVAGAAAAIAVGCGLSRLMLGAFDFGAFLASALPLLIPILNDHRRAAKIAAEIDRFPEQMQAPSRASIAMLTGSAMGGTLGAVAAAWVLFLT